MGTTTQRRTMGSRASEPGVPHRSTTHPGCVGPVPQSDGDEPAGFWSFLKQFKTHLYIAYAIRVVLILYGDYQDSTMLVKYTDVDYKVFTDAAQHVWHDRSPFDRHTYRYTPLLAWMVLPNVTVSHFFGKYLFCGFDIIAGHLIYAHVRIMLFRITGNHQYVETWARRCAYLWLYNPLVMGVSSRGNAESIVITLVLAMLLLYQERVYFLTGIALGMAIHFKIYPIIYSLPMYMALTDGQSTSWIVNRFAPNSARIRLVLGTVITFSLLTGVCYLAYGWKFIDEAYLYHISRKDTRHNFSAYFYMLYLTVEDDDIGINLLTFLPQVILLLAVAKQFGSHPNDIPFCLFAQTFIFVAYNKVVTSQYFLWYLSLLPLVFPARIRLSKTETITVTLLWLFTQASWLLPAYFLEFKGYNTFQFVWIESLAFYAGNIGILSKFVRKYRELQAILLQERTSHHHCD